MKSRRQEMIIELIANNRIETQEELADQLSSAGFKVTQATISRDIRELRLTKVAGENGRQYYAVLSSGDDGKTERYIRVLKEGFLSMEDAGNLLVIKTVEGMAMAVAAALDNLNFREIIGCIAGDDTIFCAIKNADDTLLIRDKINVMLAS